MDCSTSNLLSPPLSPRVYSNSSSLSQWCYLTISSFATSFSFYFQSFSAFFSNELALCTRRSEYRSFSFSNSSSSEYSGFPLGLTGLIYCWPRDSQKSFPAPSFESIDSLTLFMVQVLHPYMTTGETTALTIWTFVGKVMALLFNILSRFVIAFLPRSKHFLILWMQSPSTVILEPKKRKSVIASTFLLLFAMMGENAMILVLWMLNFKPAFSLSSVTPSKRFFSSSSLCH